MRTRLRRVLLGALLAALIPFSVAAGQGQPRAVIEQFHSVLLGVMQEASSLGFQGRYDRLAPAIEESFNLPLMAQWIVWPHWKKLNEDQRNLLVDAFSRMTIATYAARFDDYSGQRFEVLAEEETKREDVLVKSRIIKSNGEPVLLNYLMHPDGEGWRIIDIHLKGKFSELATRKADYGSVLRREGFDILLQKIDRKIEKLAKE